MDSTKALLTVIRIREIIGRTHWCAPTKSLDYEIHPCISPEASFAV